jgi:hypothetical protein
MALRSAENTLAAWRLPQVHRARMHRQDTACVPPVAPHNGLREEINEISPRIESRMGRLY